MYDSLSKLNPFANGGGWAWMWYAHSGNAVDQMVVQPDDTSVRLDFIDMQQAAPLDALRCGNVMMLNDHQMMSADGSAVYVGQVEMDELHGDAAWGRLDELGFGFHDARGRTATLLNAKIHHLHMERGEICIGVC